MRSYVITQSGEKSQKCNKCEYLVSHANTLKVFLKSAYMKIHPGENELKCNISEATNLSTKKTHTGEKNVK